MALSKIDTAAIATDAIEAAQLKSDAIASGDLPAGTILQVVEAVSTAGVNINSSTYSDLPGMSVNITPSSTSSTILVQYSVHSFTAGGTTSAGWGGCGTRVLRGSTKVYSDSDAHDSGGGYGTGCNTNYAPDRIMDRDAHIFEDSPSSTSQLTYKVQGNEIRDRGGSAQFNYYGAPARIVVMEIAG